MRFTLIEVVTAIGILALSLAGMLQLLTSSQQRIGKSADLWLHTHILMQAAEYTLLQKGQEEISIPQEIFDYPDYFANITFEEVVEQLPEELDKQQGQLPLTGVNIEIMRVRNQEKVIGVVVDRFNYEENTP